jgi:hypothetical protein
MGKQIQLTQQKTKQKDLKVSSSTRNDQVPIKIMAIGIWQYVYGLLYLSFTLLIKIRKASAFQKKKRVTDNDLDI